MAGVRGMLARVQRLERSRELPQLAYLGSPEFEAEIRAEVADKKLDRVDWIGEDGNGGVLAALKRWSQDRVWTLWQ